MKKLFSIFLLILSLISCDNVSSNILNRGYINAVKTQELSENITIENLAIFLILKIEGYSFNDMSKYEKVIDEKANKIYKNSNYYVVESKDKNFSIDKDVIMEYKDINVHIPVIKNGNNYVIEYEKIFAQKGNKKYTYTDLIIGGTFFQIGEWFKDLFR